MNTAGSKRSLSRQLAAYSRRFSLDRVPPDVVSHARFLLLDLLGAALAGGDTPESLSARNAVCALAPDGPCTLWGTRQRTTAPGAALANGVSAHARELDDFGGADHTGAVVIPALLAMAEAHPPLSGKIFLEAMIIGYETGRRLLDACGGYRPHNHGDGFHSTGTVGSLAAASATAKLMDLDEDETVWALGLAGSFTGGTWAFSADGAMGKRFNVGRAAETGVTSAVLAAKGFTGPEFVFEAEWGGFFSTYARENPCPEKLVKDLGNTFGIMRSGIKPYAACRDIHSSLDVVLNARRTQHLAAGEISRIDVNCTPEMYQMVGRVITPRTRLEAQLSLPYSLAVALVTGRAFPAEYESPFLNDKTVLDLVGRVNMVIDKSLPFDSEPHIALFTCDDKVIKGHVPQACGSHLNPLAPEKIIEKYDMLTADILPPEHARDLKEAVLSVDRQKNMKNICRYLSI